jgi:hypothetical protein
MAAGISFRSLEFHEARSAATFYNGPHSYELPADKSAYVVMFKVFEFDGQILEFVEVVAEPCVNLDDVVHVARTHLVNRLCKLGELGALASAVTEPEPPPSVVIS